MSSSEKSENCLLLHVLCSTASVLKTGSLLARLKSLKANNAALVLICASFMVEVESYVHLNFDPEVSVC